MTLRILSKTSSGRFHPVEHHQSQDSHVQSLRPARLASDVLQPPRTNFILRPAACHVRVTLVAKASPSRTEWAKDSGFSLSSYHRTKLLSFVSHLNNFATELELQDIRHGSEARALMLEGQTEPCWWHSKRWAFVERWPLQVAIDWQMQSQWLWDRRQASEMQRFKHPHLGSEIHWLDRSLTDVQGRNVVIEQSFGAPKAALHFLCLAPANGFPICFLFRRGDEGWSDSCEIHRFKVANQECLKYPTKVCGIVLKPMTMYVFSCWGLLLWWMWVHSWWRQCGSMRRWNWLSIFLLELILTDFDHSNILYTQSQT